MLRIRLVEERIAEEYAHQEMRCPVHLYIGQEGIAAGVSEALRPSDYVMSSHRSHGHYLAKGGDLPSMIAEIYGRVEGSSRGKGGSMHLFDSRVGFLGSSAIVAGSVPIACGLALASKTLQQSKVAVAYFGDGACEEGVVYETLNIAVLKKLPILFVCEQNYFSVLTHISERQRHPFFADRARAFGMPAHVCDGNDVLSVHSWAKEACELARNGGGPSFLEASTYRWRTHCGPGWDAPQATRSEAELLLWQERCPIRSLEQQAISAGLIAAEEVQALRVNIENEINLAFANAKVAPWPATEELGAHVYA